MPISKLLFLHNELISPSKQKEMGVPLQFITFAHVPGKMYKQSNNNGTFITNQGRPWGNKVVYGAIFLLEDDNFYMRILDSYHGCSLSTLRVNHKLDIQHREKTYVTPISFDSVTQLEQLLYTEREIQQVELYVGNIKHKKIKPRTLDNGRHRIQDGILAKPYLQLIEEVLH